MLIETTSNDIPGPSVGITDLINYSLVEAAEREELKIRQGLVEKSPFRPSSAGECERALAYKGIEYLGKNYYEKKTPEANVQLIFALGHAIEAMLLKVFEKIEYFQVKYTQQVLSFFLLKSGDIRLDQIVEGSNDLCMVGTFDNWRGIIDIKSKATGVGSYRRTKWEEMDDKLRKMKSVKEISPTSYWVESPEDFIKELNDPFMAMNIWQLNLYAMSEFMRERGFDFCSLLYFSKDNSFMREIRFKPSLNLYNKVEARFQSAAKAAAQNNPALAKQEFLLGSVKCAYCPYVRHCWGVDEHAALKESYKNNPKKVWPLDLDRNEEYSEMATTVAEYFESDDMVHVRKELESHIMKFMLEQNVDKIQTVVAGIKVVYELRKGKTTMSLKRSKA